MSSLHRKQNRMKKLIVNQNKTKDGRKTKEKSNQH